MDTRWANTTDVHPGGNIPIVLFMVVLDKTGWNMARRTRDEKTKGRHESCFKVCGE